MKNNRKILIFDMDGVILDSEPLHENARQMLYDKYGIDKLKHLPDPVGKSSMEYWQLVLAAAGLKENPVALEEEQYALVARQISDQKLQPSRGLVQVLKWAKTAKYRIGLASSSTRRLVDFVLDYMQIKSYFDITVSGNEVDEKKPSPEIYEKILQCTKSISKDALAVEDSSSGVEAARAAGIFCYGYINPTSGNQDLTHADCRINALTDIVRINAAR